MKITILNVSPVILCAVILITSCLKPAPKESFETWSTQNQNYALYVPAHSGDKPLPVVMYLHPAGDNPSPGYRSFWIIGALNAIEPCAVFLPHHPYNPLDQGAGWGGTYDAELRESLKEALSELDAKIRKHKLDANRQYAYGDSMGGEGVFQLAAKLPGRFSGLVSVAGYTESGAAAEIAKTPLWMLYSKGDTDWNVAAASRKLHAAILEAGGAVTRVTEYDSGNTGMEAHMYAIYEAKGDPEVLGWLLSR